MVDAALELAGAGWSVFPLHRMTGDGILDELACSCGKACSSPGKHPRTINGVLDASIDPDRIRGWFTNTVTNVGLATGATSGVYVVDLDGPEGLASWKHLASTHGLDRPATVAKTGSGGWHLYYGIPLDDELPNTAGRLGIKIDTRGRGGYVVAPPSNHKSGGVYSWSQRGRELPPLPDVLRDLLKPQSVTPLGVPTISGETSPYGHGVLVNAAGRITAAPEGARNQRLNEEAFLVGQFIGGGEIDPAGVEAILAGACTGPDVKKNTATVRRGLHAGMMHPRSKDSE